jgi:pyrroline-5-carboxylate reductase
MMRHGSSRASASAVLSAASLDARRRPARRLKFPIHPRRKNEMAHGPAHSESEKKSTAEKRPDDTNRAPIDRRLAVLGAGKMGGILIEAFVKQGLLPQDKISATVGHAGAERRNIGGTKIHPTTDNRAAARAADVILLCVKPQNVGHILDEIQPELDDQKLVISIAASVTTETIERRLGLKIPVVRAMPNTPSIVGAGITAICRGKYAAEFHLDLARKLFDAVGKTVAVDEKHMDAITGLSGSGPAFIYIILESLAEGGVKMGLSRELATLLAAQTALGAAKVALETGSHPALLKDMVTTPAGCTIDGILELEEGKLRVTLIKAVVKASQRARELQFNDRES